MLQIRIYPQKSNTLEWGCPVIVNLSNEHFNKNDLKYAMQEIDYFRMIGINSYAEFIANHKMVMHLEAYSYPDEETGKFKRTNWYLGKTYFGDHAVIRKWGC